MTSRKPPSQRDPEYAVQRISRAVQSMSPGSMGGRVANAAPITSGRGAGLVLGGGGGAGGYVPPERRIAVYTTGALAVNEPEKGLIEMGSRFRIQYITTSAQARVRLYARVMDQESDFGRPILYDPPPHLGIIMDFLTATEFLDAPLSPEPEGSTFGTAPNEPGATTVPITVTAIDGGSVTVTLTYVHLE